MVAAELIDEHVSANQCKLAVEALLTHEKRREEKQQDSQLLPGKEQHVWLQVTVKQMHPEKKLKPHKIPLAHPLVDPRTSPVCLITKDPQREYKDLLETNNIRFISRVVGVTKLKGKFKPFEARRLLLKENDLFLADERVVPLLPGLLGKKFFEAKKQPIPVCLTRKDLKGELERAISSTYFHQNQGTCSSIKVGAVSHPSAHVLANLKTALPAVAKAIKGGWENIQSLHIKTSTSTSLPIWSCELGADVGGRWDGLVEQKAGGESGEEEVASEAETEVEVAASKPAKAKGKKRAAEDEEAQPKKKRAKASPVDTPSTPAADGSSKKKRKTAKDVPATPVSVVAAPATPATGPVASEGTATPQTQEGKKKRKGGPAQPVPSSSSSAEAATPTAASKKKSRAAAAEFFADELPAGGVAPPPNTPADGLKAGKKSRRAAAEQTPVRGAIARLSEDKTSARAPAASSVDPAPVPAGDKPSKKAKSKQPGVAAADAEGDGGEKKLKKKAKGDDKPAESPAAPPATVSVEDVKRKRGASGLEKKKEKALKVKRSAKEALIGKKGL